MRRSRSPPRPAIIEAEREGINGVSDIPELMGIEGRSRDAYYGAWPAILGDGPGAAFPFGTRERRPPSNELNALISFGNAMCYTAALKQIYRTALDPTISYLHEPGDRRFSLALDLAEIFKPLLVDRAIFRLIKTGEITPRHFEPRLGGTYLTERGAQDFCRALGRAFEKDDPPSRLGSPRQLSAPGPARVLSPDPAPFRSGKRSVHRIPHVVVS